MSAAHPRFDVKGWCPSALHPMESGDGLIVRIYPPAACLNRRQMQAIATASERYGNGCIDLTRRGNLQIRGAAPGTLGALYDELRAYDLLDDTPERVAMRHMLISPLAGIDTSEVLDMRPLARALAERLPTQRGGAELPAKFSIVLDGGGRLSLASERADIRAVACGAEASTMIMIACGDDNWLGMTEPDNAATSICAIIAGEMPKLQPVETLNVQNRYIKATWGEILPFGTKGHVVGIGVPFGRLEAGQLRVLSEISAELRPSPWRTLFIPASDFAIAEQAMSTAREAGFAGVGDVRIHIQACPGRPACRSAHADTRTDAVVIARCMEASGFEGTVHVSGCAKGCASSGPADITLVGVPGGYRLMLHAAARDEGGIVLEPADIPERLNFLMQVSGHV